MTRPTETATPAWCGILVYLASAVVLGSLVWFEYLRAISPGWPCMEEAFSLIDNPDTQWTAMALAAGYFLFFWGRNIISAVKNGEHPTNVGARLCLLAIGLMTISAYALHYENAVEANAQAKLAGGNVTAEALFVVVGLTLREIAETMLNKVSHGRFKLLAMLAVLLSAAALFQTDVLRDYAFRYQAAPRWTGAWKNPNTYGLMMGTGLVVCLGLLSYASTRSREGQRQAPGWCAAFFLLGAVMTSIGLVRSYSRGAWIGTALALGMFSLLEGRVASTKGGVLIRLLKRNVAPIGAIFFCSLLLIASQGHHAESSLTRRLSSVRNANDFSWQNRLASYKGALQIITDRPLQGYGWNQPLKHFDNFYLPDRMNDAYALILNDFFMIGMVLGMPALLVLAAYLYLAFGIIDDGFVRENSNDCLRNVCHACILIFLAGFWFDGGLFKMSLTGTFWILAALGSSKTNRIETTRCPGNPI